MGHFTFEEMNLMCIYNTGTRAGLMESLTEMRGYLSPEETELMELTDSALHKLRAMTDAEFDSLELYPDLDVYKRQTPQELNALLSGGGIPGVGTPAPNAQEKEENHDEI